MTKKEPHVHTDIKIKERHKRCDRNTHTHTDEQSMVKTVAQRDKGMEEIVCKNLLKTLLTT